MQIPMQNSENQEENLENNMAVEEVESQDEAETTNEDPDYKTLYEVQKNKAAMFQRILNKQQSKPKAETNSLRDEDRKVLEEVKTLTKVNNFSKETGLSIEQTEYLFKLNPNATSETLKDPFFKAGLEAIGKKSRIENNTPNSGRTFGQQSSKPFKEMSFDEKKSQFNAMMGN